MWLARHRKFEKHKLNYMICLFRIMTTDKLMGGGVCSRLLIVWGVGFEFMGVDGGVDDRGFHNDLYLYVS